MEHIILIGHGSPKKEANNIDIVGQLLHGAIHPGCSNSCVRSAYLEFGKPDIMGAIRQCVEDGAKKIIAHPYFLSSGMHVTRDIPEIIAEARSLFTNVELVYTEPLGIHDKLVEIVIERIKNVRFNVPMDIEKRSFEIIAEETDLNDISAEQIPVIKRVIHSTADFEFKNTLVFHTDAVKAGIAAIRAGRDILTDIEMVKAGINKKLLDKWGGRVVCGIADDEVAKVSEATGRTRSEIAMEKGLSGNAGIVAIGNAPTALLKVIEILNSQPSTLNSQPLIVGVPVGFVKALESKALLAAQNFPFITNLSRKGGTPVAVAIVNALLKMAEGGDGKDS
ncbi:MAG: precorrin-8X methylmutase [Nitrospiraceae bacterium]|nr:precorrin-8X methylmutase [Nitrospiraceae bacterium]